MTEAEELEKIWRAVFRMVFKVHPSTPTAHFYGGRADVVADPLHGRHVIVDAVGALYSTCRRALASPEDSPERALARSALARRARKWGCTRTTDEWLGSKQHLDAAVVVEREMETAVRWRWRRLTSSSCIYGVVDTTGRGDISGTGGARREAGAPTERHVGGAQPRRVGARRGSCRRYSANRRRQCSCSRE